MLFLSVFGVVGICKIFLSIYIVLLWLNEYYEITPENIIHKRGIIFRKSEMYRLSKVREIKVHDSFLGELLNFATITLYDIRLQKYLDLYLIHNPKRYERILKTLRPSLEVQTDRVHIPFTREE
ncbi:PH domain-containing protein [Candidatus Microgenomates bacterium]|nr:PH domain-containing protein [Candidatus Microgenomates bacterium]